MSEYYFKKTNQYIFMEENILKNDLNLVASDIKIIVKEVHIEGRGAILLTGPSSCGKGEIAKSLCKFLSIPKDRHLSMGEILRITIRKAKEDEVFRRKLDLEYNISNSISIFDINNNKNEVINKAESYKDEIISSLNIKDNFISQFNWLEFCVTKGLLVPDEWTVNIIDAVFSESEDLKSNIFILDGYPRTTVAAEKLLETFNKLSIPIIKIIHLSITKEQMKIRALSRKRNDDTEESLERRYQFYVDKVQPCIDYLKCFLGYSTVALIDAHQPIFNENGTINLEKSIHAVTLSVMKELGLPSFLLDIN